MNNDFTLAQSVEKDIDNIAQLFAKKSAQYWNNSDSLANFRQGALLAFGNDTNENMFKVAKMYLLKHVSMLYADTSFHKVNMDESLMDIAVYALIMRYMLLLNKQDNISAGKTQVKPKKFLSNVSKPNKAGGQQN